MSAAAAVVSSTGAAAVARGSGEVAASRAAGSQPACFSASRLRPVRIFGIPRELGECGRPRSEGIVPPVQSMVVQSIVDARSTQFRRPLALHSFTAGDHGREGAGRRGARVKGCCICGGTAACVDRRHRQRWRRRWRRRNWRRRRRQRRRWRRRWRRPVFWTRERKSPSLPAENRTVAFFCPPSLSSSLPSSFFPGPSVLAHYQCLLHRCRGRVRLWRRWPSPTPTPSEPPSTLAPWFDSSPLILG